MKMSRKGAAVWLQTISLLLMVLAPRSVDSSMFLHGNLGRVQSIASIEEGGGGPEAFKAAVTLTLKDILTTYAGASGDGDLDVHAVSTDSNKDKKGNHHIRFQQYMEGLPIKGAAMVVHIRGGYDRTVYALSGEYASNSHVFNQVNLNCFDAMELALSHSGIQGNTKWISECREAAVRGRDGYYYLGFERTLLYEGYKQAVLFASGENGALVAFHPIKAYAFNSVAREPDTSRENAYEDARAESLDSAKGQKKPKPKLETRNCEGVKVSNDDYSACPIFSTSSKPVHTGNIDLDKAHNFAIMTYRFYYRQYGRDSLDDKGATLVSNVYYNDVDECPNAWYSEGAMFYCPPESSAYSDSRALDIVAHELTHGVTAFTSDLIYADESGAINEAMSDIFGATIERIMLGKSIKNTWLIGEDTYKNSSGFLRDMSDPPSDAGDSRDFYPDRYVGNEDYGGVHTNSGIANLAYVLMVQGGMHPRGKTNFTVTPLDKNFNKSILKANALFYDAQTKCLTPSATFESTRECTLLFATKEERPSVQDAWAAVGVGEQACPTKSKKGAKAKKGSC